MSCKLREFIRSVRAAQTAADERAVIAKECAEIRTAFKDGDTRTRARNVAKALFISMLGYPTEFAQLECVKLIASSRFGEKRVGYLGLSCLLDAHSEVLLLATNTIQQDLQHPNQYVNALALTALASVGAADMCAAAADCLSRGNPFTLKKALLCAARSVRLAAYARAATATAAAAGAADVSGITTTSTNTTTTSTSTTTSSTGAVGGVVTDSAAVAAVAAAAAEEESCCDERFISALTHALRESDHGVQLAACGLLTALLQQPLYPKTALFASARSAAAAAQQKLSNALLPDVAKALLNCRLWKSEYRSAEYDVAGVSDPFLHCSLMRVASMLLEHVSPEVGKPYLVVDLLFIAVNTSGTKNAGNSVLFECARSVIRSKKDGVYEAVFKNLSRMLTCGDPNAKYVALGLLQQAAAVDLEAVMERKDIIVDCLKDADPSLRRRAVEVIFSLMVREKHVVSLVKELLNALLLLGSTDLEFKHLVINKIVQATLSVGVSMQWQLDTLFKIMSIAGQTVDEVVTFSFIEVAMAAPQLQNYVVHKVFFALQDPFSSNAAIWQAGLYCIGEFGDLLVQPLKQKRQMIGDMINTAAAKAFQISEKQVADLLLSYSEQMSSLPSQQRVTLAQTLVIAVAKLATRLPSQRSRLVGLLKHRFLYDVDMEVQQRATEFLGVLESAAWADSSSSIFDRMPFIDNSAEEDGSPCLEEEDTANLNVKEAPCQGIHRAFAATTTFSGGAVVDSSRGRRKRLARRCRAIGEGCFDPTDVPLLLGADAAAFSMDAADQSVQKLSQNSQEKATNAAGQDSAGAFGADDFFHEKRLAAAEPAEEDVFASLEKSSNSFTSSTNGIEEKPKAALDVLSAFDELHSSPSQNGPTTEKDSSGSYNLLLQYSNSNNADKFSEPALQLPPPTTAVTNKKTSASSSDLDVLSELFTSSQQKTDASFSYEQPAVATSTTTSCTTTATFFPSALHFHTPTPPQKNAAATTTTPPPFSLSLPAPQLPLLNTAPAASTSTAATAVESSLAATAATTTRTGGAAAFSPLLLSTPPSAAASTTHPTPAVAPSPFHLAAATPLKKQAFDLTATTVAFNLADSTASTTPSQLPNLTALTAPTTTEAAEKGSSNPLNLVGLSLSSSEGSGFSDNAEKSCVIPVFREIGDGVIVQLVCMRLQQQQQLAPLNSNSCASIRVEFRNSSSSVVTDLLFEVAVPKYLSLSLEPASGTVLPPFSSGIITQQMFISRLEHGDKPLMIKCRISFTKDGSHKQECVNVTNFPPSLLLS